MKSMNNLIKINCLGGLVNALVIEKITKAALYAGIEYISLGSRQNIWIKCNSNNQMHKIISQLTLENITHEVNQELYPNIVSSFPAEGIFTFDGWITEGNYRTIFDLFDFEPQLKVNIIDSGQTFTPYFTGHLNFITSDIPNYWYLYWRLPKSLEIFLWPKLIYSTAIPQLVKIFDEIVKKQRIREKPRIVELIESQFSYLSCEMHKEMELPYYQFSYYEGFNRIENDYWLGIYKRNNRYSIQFLKDMAELCQQTNVPIVCLTPWKSLLIKRIFRKDRILWEKMLDKHGINVRHAALELNWIVEDHAEEAELLKNEIVNELYKEDIRTYGLIFGIKINESCKLPASVIFSKNSNGYYDLFHTENFNPFHQNLLLFKKNLSNKSQIIQSVIEICRFYYSQYNYENYNRKNINTSIEKINTSKNPRKAYQCLNCLHVSIPELNYSKKIEINKLFCPVCESGYEFISEIVIELEHV